MRTQGRSWKNGERQAVELKEHEQGMRKHAKLEETL